MDRGGLCHRSTEPPSWRTGDVGGGPLLARAGRAEESHGRGDGPTGCLRATGRARRRSQEPLGGGGCGRWCASPARRLAEKEFERSIGILLLLVCPCLPRMDLILFVCPQTGAGMSDDWKTPPVHEATWHHVANPYECPQAFRLYLCSKLQVLLA